MTDETRIEENTLAAPNAAVGYSEDNPDHVPNPADHMGTLDTTDTAGANYSNLNQVSSVFQAADEANAQRVEQATAAEVVQTDINGYTNVPIPETAPQGAFQPAAEGERQEWQNGEVQPGYAQSTAEDAEERAEELTPEVTEQVEAQGDGQEVPEKTETEEAPQPEPETEGVPETETVDTTGTDE